MSDDTPETSNEVYYSWKSICLEEMMNTDIRVKTSLMGCRKLKKMVKTLDIDESHAVGLLTCLWVRTGIDSPKGILKDWDNQDIADAAGWTNNADDFVKALKDIGWVDWDGRKKCYRIHDWEVHQSWACHADERSELARKAVNVRWNQSDTDSNTGRNTDGNTPLLSSPIPSVSSPSPNPSSSRSLSSPTPSPALSSPILLHSNPEPRLGTTAPPSTYKGGDMTDVHWYRCNDCNNKHQIKNYGDNVLKLGCPDCGNKVTTHQRCQ